ncbi:MAG TPA: peptidase domain-containing ABC transporter [Saprospiraceae bacterium]|nr:peptidase domain-containing ABC transporter [Saprospiraceae bacterium]
MKFPFTHQLGARDCGPACLKMVAEYYGQKYALGFLRDKCHITKVGVSLLGISEAAESIGLHSIGAKMDLRQMKEIVQDGPVILHWKETHFVVVYKTPKPDKQGSFYIADPATGYITYTEEEFKEQWIEGTEHRNKGFADMSGKQLSKEIGYCLLLEPTPAFYDEPQMDGLIKKVNLHQIWKYFTPHKKIFYQLLVMMFIGSGIMLLTPFLTQALVDKGINLHDLSFVYLILIAQLVLFAGNSIAEIVRSKLLLHMGTRINISMVSDFLSKMLRLPIPFFEKHIAGDLMQRMSDHHRIENLLTVSSLSSIFSLVNFIVLSVVLAVYSVFIFIVFMLGCVGGFIWTLLYLAKRRKIDFKFFDLYSKENNKVIEIMYGIQDLKISNSTQQKRWEWEKIQGELYKLKIRALTIGQYQNVGSSIFRQGTAVIITFLAARYVMNDSITLGTMFAITMIVGQLNSPLEQLRQLITSWQDARLGLERINDVLVQKDEDPEDVKSVSAIPDQEDIIIRDLTFGYGSEQLEPVLKEISMVIPAGKITAIVGASGSGKTTLMKLLLRFYDSSHGSIYLGEINFLNLHHGAWRQKCGVVMQDGQLFSGTIASNISMGQEQDFDKIMRAAQIANCDEFILALPLGFLTEVGDEGNSLSAGQTQRILLARAVFKDPDYLFLDEATSALDAVNEKKVMDNLNLYFKNKTVIIIAHRLSTVMNADQVIVLDQGKIIESGSHLKLIEQRGSYYTLIRNQLELGG